MRENYEDFRIKHSKHLERIIKKNSSVKAESTTNFFKKLENYKLLLKQMKLINKHELFKLLIDHLDRSKDFTLFNSVKYLEDFNTCGPTALIYRVLNSKAVKQKYLELNNNWSYDSYLTSRNRKRNIQYNKSVPVNRKPNRKGQKERRREWEEKYGSQANHLVRRTSNSGDQVQTQQALEKSCLHPSWMAKRSQNSILKNIKDIPSKKIAFVED
jgi:hypothetical protein